LFGGDNEFEGNVFVWNNSSKAYEGVCEYSHWSSTEATTTCAILGFTGGKGWDGEILGLVRPSMYAMTNVECTGSESSLFECKYDSTDIICWNGRPVGVQCDQPTTTNATITTTSNTTTVNTTTSTESNTTTMTTATTSTTSHLGPLKLVGGRNEREGSVIVWDNSSQSDKGVCVNSMIGIDAAIVCSMLGFPGGAFSNRPSHYGMLAAGDFAMANVDCTGSENSLLLQI
jgi:hypothetical protein